jgi:PAS domain S-box-containing protein
VIREPTDEAGPTAEGADRAEAVAADPALDQTRLRLALNATGLGIWDWDLIAGTMTWTERAKAIYGFPPGEPVTFENVRAATHPEDLPRTSAMSRRALDPAQRAKEPYEFRIVRPNGEVRWIDAHGEAVFAVVDGVERAIRYTGTIQDVTERRRAEEDLRVHALLLEQMSEGVSLSREDGTIVYTNAAEDAMFGYAPGELVGRNVSIQNAYPPAENARRVAAVLDHLSKHGSWEGEWRNRRKDGSEFITDARINAVEIGGRRHWLCVQRDVTEARLLEEQTRASEARLRLAIDAASLAVWEYDGRADTIVGSPELNRIFGLPPERQATIAEIRAGNYPGERDRVRAAALEALQRGERHVQTEFRYVWPSGEVRWLLLRAEILPDEEGELTRALGVVIDITDQKRTEEALRESRERLDLAARAHRIGIFDWDFDTGRVDWSAEEERLFGLAPGAFEGTIEGWRRRVLPEDLQRIEEAIRAAMRRNEATLDLEFRIRREDGEVRHIEGSGRAIYDGDGRPRRLVGVNIDVTARKRAEEDQRILIGELNHRVKNTLAIVNSIAAQSLRDAADPADARMAFIARIGALAEAHDVLTRRSWSGAELGEIAAAVLRPHLLAEGERISLGGPSVALSPPSAVALSMVLHELATNAAKYGALSTSRGAVDVAWEIDESGGRPALTLRWREHGGPRVAPPARQGFGSRYIERGWAASGDTEVGIDYRPEGLVCTLVTRRRDPASAAAPW